MVKEIKSYLPSSKYSLKAPNSMTAKGITLHNTANDAAAQSEINYMKSNSNSTGFHTAIDNVSIVHGIPHNRNAWHAGDGVNGYGNRNHIGIEICYSLSGGAKYDEGETNAIKYTAKLLKSKGWGINKVKKHQDWSGKNCPHRILARSRGWQGIINAIQNELDKLGGKKDSVTVKPRPKPTKKPAKSVGSVVDYLNAKGINSSYANRKKLASKHGISNYKGTASQNTTLLSKLKSGSKPTSKPKVTGSVVDYLKSKKIDSSFANRKKLAAKHGIKNYQGTESQNVALLNKLQGSTPKPSKPKTSYKVGSTVTLKNTASKFATGQSILDSAKGKRYKIIQTKSDRVLLDKIMSWVKKSDVQ